MKTVIPEFKDSMPYTDKRDFIFHHGKDVSISRQVHSLAETTYMYKLIQQKKEHITEMEFIVIRFPKHLKPDYSGNFYSDLRSVYHHQWKDDGDYVELMLEEGNLWRTLHGLAEAGIFRLDTKLYPDFYEGRYFPFYCYPTRLWQRALNCVTLLLSVPQVTGMLFREVFEKMTQKKSKERKFNGEI